MNKSKEEVLSDYFEKANLNTEIGEHFFTLNILLSKILLKLEGEENTPSKE